MQTARLVCVFLLFVKGNVCDLTISPTSPASVEALVGSSVTLHVSHGGSAQPDVMWFLGSRLVAKWTIGNSSVPVVSSSEVAAEADGSFTLKNVSLSDRGTYTVELISLGEGRVSSMFHLSVYDIITSVVLLASPSDAAEGDVRFTLSYSTVQGEAETTAWFFNGLQIENGSHYSISGNSLSINHPSRNDTGLYTVVLANPFSSQTRHRNCTVMYGPEMPVLKISPTKAAFVSGESVLLSCQAEAVPPPSATWFFNGGSIPTSSTGTANLTNVKTSQSGIYTCMVINTITKTKLERNITIQINEAALTGAALAGIAAGIPCVVLLLLLLVLFIYCGKPADRNPTYPKSKSEKVTVSPPFPDPCSILASEGQKTPVDIRHEKTFQPEHTPSLPSVDLSVRMATTV